MCREFFDCMVIRLNSHSVSAKNAKQEPVYAHRPAMKRITQGQRPLTCTRLRRSE